VLTVRAEIHILRESVSFLRGIDAAGQSKHEAWTLPQLLQRRADDAARQQDVMAAVQQLRSGGSEADEVLSGKFVWRVDNFCSFEEMIRAQKVMSPTFPAGGVNLRLSAYQSSVGDAEYLSLCLEAKDTDKFVALPSDRSAWCLFRLTVVHVSDPDFFAQPNSPEAVAARERYAAVGEGKNLHRDSYGRFASDTRAGDNTSLGWNDFVKMATFRDVLEGYLVDGRACFRATVHVMKESTSFLPRDGAVPGCVDWRNWGRLVDLYGIPYGESAFYSQETWYRRT